jgi:hypothetical protein
MSKAKVTNVWFDTSNQWVGRIGEVINTIPIPQPAPDDYFVEVLIDGVSLFLYPFEIELIKGD